MSDERGIVTSDTTETNAERCAYIYYSSGKACGALRGASEHRPNGFSTLPWHHFEIPADPFVSSADVPSEQIATCHAHGLTDGMLCCDLHDEIFDPSQGEVCTGCYHASEQPVTLGFAPGGCMINTGTPQVKSVAEHLFRFVASVQRDACGFWRESKSNDRRAVELVFSEWSDEHEGCEPAARYSFADNEQAAAQDARSELRFCGYSVCGDRGGPSETCGKWLPCSVAGHFDAASELRRLWWFDHGCEVAALYGDDGEMQCGRCRVDFKRDSLTDLAHHVYTKKLNKLASTASPERAKARAALAESLANHSLIAANDTHVSGAARIAGTRLPVHSILYALRNAGSIEVLCRDYYSQLTKEQAVEALSFAAMFIELAAREEASRG